MKTMATLNSIACPVCTLYLRPGMTLENHLTSHPKNKVIEALIRVTELGPENVEKVTDSCPEPVDSTSIVTAFPQINANPEVTTFSQMNVNPGMTTFSHINENPDVATFSQINVNSGVTTLPQMNVNSGVTTLSQMSVNPRVNTFPQISVNPRVTTFPQMNQNLNQVPTNHSFIYQQFMSTSGTQPVINMNPMNQMTQLNPINQQFVAVPTVYRPQTQMVMPQYIFQQQQQVQIVSGAPNSPIQPCIPPISNMSTSIRAPATNVRSCIRGPVNILPRIRKSTANIQSIQHVLQLPTLTPKPAICAPPFSQVNVQDPLLPTPGPSVCTSPVPQDPLNTDIPNISYSKSNEISLSYSPISNKSFRFESVSTNVELSSIENYNLNNNDDGTGIVDLVEDDDKYKDDDISAESNNVSVIVQNHSKIEETKDENDKACQTTEKLEEKEEKEEILDTESHKEPTNDSSKMVLIATEHEIFNQNQTLHIVSNHNNGVIQRNIECDTDNDLQTDNGLEENVMNFILPNDSTECEEIIANELSRSSEREFEDNRPPVLTNIEEADEDNISSVVINIGEETLANEDIIVGAPDYEEDISDKIDEDYVSRESLNIRADEKMPARGELSEQESNGASEIGWGSRIYQEGSSGMSTSYDLLARESWEASDCSDSEMPPLQSRNQPPIDYSEENVDDPDFEDGDDKTRSPTFEFSCMDCNQTFRCPKERRVHQANEHASCSSSSTVKKRTRNIPNSSNDDEDNKLDLFKTEDGVSEVEKKHKSNTENEIVDSKDNVLNQVLCNTCGELLPSMKDLTVHNKKIHQIILPNHKLTCKMCDEPFRKLKEYINHLKIHPLECIICGKQFYKPSNLKLHLKRHSGIKPHKCEQCEKSFFARQKLREHTNTHTGNSPIKCNMCDEKFKRYSNLIQHRNYHHLKLRKKTRDFICHCGEICPSKSKLNWHKETHEPKPKSCTFCNEKFIHMASLTRHIRRAHNQHYMPDEHRKEENVECKICKGIYLKSSIEAHRNIHLGKKQHACTICNKEFTTKWNLKLHKWTHAAPTNKPFKCDICQSAYFRESDYTSHMNSHRSVKPYTCNYCGCKFIRKYNCVRHVKEHEEGKSYNCDVCSKSFHRSYYLKEHMRVHTGARPFSCNICGKTSTTKSNHNKHMKIHHAREPVTTEG